MERPQGLENLELNDAAVALRAAAALRATADRVEERGVALARSQGWSWEQIGDAMGVSRQAAHAKYGRRWGGARGSH